MQRSGTTLWPCTWADDGHHGVVRQREACAAVRASSQLDVQHLRKARVKVPSGHGKSNTTEEQVSIKLRGRFDLHMHCQANWPLRLLLRPSMSSSRLAARRHRASRRSSVTHETPGQQQSRAPHLIIQESALGRRRVGVGSRTRQCRVPCGGCCACGSTRWPARRVLC